MAMGQLCKHANTQRTDECQGNPQSLAASSNSQEGKRGSRSQRPGYLQMELINLGVSA